jgi:uncharacterized protein YkwD
MAGRGHAECVQAGMRNPRLALVVGVLAALLQGCGGGGDDAPADAGLPAHPTAQVSGATCGIADFQQRVTLRVNQWRATGANCGSEGSFGPAAALGWDSRLTTAAAVQAQDMSTHNFFAHTGSNGSTPGQRVTAAGYAWQTTGENIAAGYGSVEAVVDGWIGSAGHCANLLNPQFTQVGVACVPGSAMTTYTSYWAMELARPR